MSVKTSVKATIVNCETNEMVECVFNPKEYTFSKTNKWEEKKADKKSVASMKFGGGAPANLKLQLLFDTYESHDRVKTSRIEAGKDVREYTKGLWDMMKIDEKKKEPPHCRFEWGSLWSFEAVIESISQKFTLFDKNGTPLRAILDVSFKQIKDEGQYPPQNPTSGGNPNDHLRTIREGETLLTIAGEEYGDSAQWRYLADLNRIADPLRLHSGQMLLIKPLPLL
jgi:nucleoid-associated protein YgaU